MDEDITIINSNTRKEKIKIFYSNNKKKIFSFVFIVILCIFIFFGYGDYKTKKKIKVSDLYNVTLINFNADNKNKTLENLIQIIYQKDITYSPLSLYYIIDNNLLSDRRKINELFDVLINETALEKEIKNLIIYKKALFNADEIDESQLLDIIKPIINSESVWKSHALYLVAEYFYSKNEKKKSKEFFEKLINLPDANQNLKIKSQKRLTRDLSG